MSDHIAGFSVLCAKGWPSFLMCKLHLADKSRSFSEVFLELNMPQSITYQFLKRTDFTQYTSKKSAQSTHTHIFIFFLLKCMQPFCEALSVRNSQVHKGKKTCPIGAKKTKK